MDRAGMAALSEQLRQFCTRVGIVQRSYIESAMQVVFDIQNIRSVQLWCRPGIQTRNFINPSVSSESLEKRIAFAQALLEQRFPNFPVKHSDFDKTPSANALKLKEYLDNPYTRTAVTNIDFLAGDIRYTYDAYGYGYAEEEISDDELEEFR